MNGLGFALLAMVTTVLQHMALRRIGCSPGVTMLTGAFVVMGGLIVMHHEQLRWPANRKAWIFWMILGLCLMSTRFFLASAYDVGAKEIVVITVLSMAPIVSAVATALLEVAMPSPAEIIAALLATAAVLVLVWGKELGLA